MKKLFAILFLFSTIMYAQSAGEAGLSFLKFGFGARNIAMGDLGVASATDVSALNYNPALITNFEGSQILVTHNEWIQDVRSEMLGASFSLFKIPFALGINTTSVSDIEVRTIAGKAQSTFSAYYFFGSLSTGYEIVENLSLGITIKYLYEGLLSDEGSGLGFDFGIYYKGIIEGLNFGAAIRNVGSMNELRNKATKLPVDLRGGISYEFAVEQIKSDITLTGGVQKYTPTDDTHIHFGTEILYENLVALRAGYMTAYETKGLTAGIGLIWNDINFDYAFTPFEFSLGETHTISLMYSF